MTIKGEISFWDCGANVVVSPSKSLDLVHVMIGESLWLILNKEQCKKLVRALNNNVLGEEKKCPNK